MPKILAFDYGTVRIGLAETDDLKMMAFGLDTIPTKEIFVYLNQYLKNNTVELFVVGEPKQMDGSHSESEVFIQDFIKKLDNTYHIPIQRFDERFTSKMAFNTMISSGISKKKRQNKGLVDKISATIILQEFLNIS
ncbi:Holliday junction resolvase RuvX [Wenyingzhuangia sp. 2_MG-2023]|uniref:Holliday junction resolvase RuvX n=1 Tax=Wenyingzhuangia sp. 2_MG-2023 TaxID=3062639 RepID=UPI0026E2C3AA|nr:Holliday junction resolvase RuvX [Wenyingzhuangia sp. 2_MG-2023]MDO6738432.1 Holliday junction resolvase RuvX [Wenyingzhuangia sp. 2_MG-2023]MDO6803345.1 Holliday junction resolvase RuvX [Wenyingzhuangia sp. 1_MG-2023]